MWMPTRVNVDAKTVDSNLPGVEEIVVSWCPSPVIGSVGRCGKCVEEGSLKWNTGVDCGLEKLVDAADEQ